MQDQEQEMDLISGYLLGDLSDDQVTRIEERYFTDPSFLQQVETVEDDLIDAYVRQEMSTLDRERFERHFLASPRRREKVAQAGALMERLPQRSQPANPSPPPESLIKSGFVKHGSLASRIAAAILIVILVAVTLLFLQNSSLRREIERLQTEQQKLERSRQDLEEELAAERAGKELLDNRRDEISTVGPPRETGPSLAAFTLMPGHPRSVKNVREIRLARSVKTVRFDLAIDFSSNYTRMRAVLTRLGGPEILSRKGLVRRMQGATVVSLDVPAQLLEPGDYSMTLLTNNEKPHDTLIADRFIADYMFRIAPGQNTNSKKL